MTTLARPEQVPLDQRADELTKTLHGELDPAMGRTTNSDGYGTDRSTDTRR